MLLNERRRKKRCLNGEREICTFASEGVVENDRGGGNDSGRTGTRLPVSNESFTLSLVHYVMC